MSAIPRYWPHAYRLSNQPSGLRRWLAFSAVGGLGIVIQLVTLTALTAVAELHYLTATGLAVEAAILHNFLWHEHWTWSDRAHRDTPGWWKRLLRFQITNGALSLGGNLLLMRLLVGMGGVNPTVANVLSITLCSILNFLASDRFVFRLRHQANTGAQHVFTEVPRAVAR